MATVTWTAATGRDDPAAAAAVAGLQLACVAAYVAARAVARRQPALVPLAVLAAVVTLSWVVRGPVGVGSATAPPLGYANADAALFLQAGVAAAMVALALPAAKGVAVAAGVVMAAAAPASGSVAGAAALAVVLGLWMASRRKPALAAGGGMVAVLVVVAATAGIAVSSATGTHPSVVDRAGDLVQRRRVALWGDAAAIARTHPVTGAGAGSFEGLRRTAPLDEDARWAHSDFLQQGAEGGAIALGLVLAAFGWGFARVAAAGAADPFVACGALSLAALGLAAGVDYVLHFSLVPLAAAALAGAATARGRAAGSPG
ncbi:MAG TPA: O-antigen ligase family protein [Acidimicrobiales bacterium]|nr:O-antigen ligase family protein [Acidimicrobiales bacterium]